MKLISAFIFTLLFSLVGAKAFQSRLLFEKVDGYNLDIYLPDNYQEGSSYKSIYFNDGQSVFGLGGLNLKESLDSLIDSRILEPIIVVGIHSDQLRTDKYVPYDDSYIFPKPRSANNLAIQYAKTIIEEIVPFIESKFSVSELTKDRAIFGYSFGGLQATWMTLNHPEIFSFCGALSPSYWVGNYKIFADANMRQDGQIFWFDIGTREWNYYVPMIDALQKRGGTYGENIFYYEIPEGEHNVKWWSQRIVYPVILFAGREPSEPKRLRVEMEVIASQSNQGVYFQRLNPIVTCQNGIKYSLATAATYEILNPEAGSIKSDGRFEFTNEENLKVKVSYKNLSKQAVVNYKQVERMK